MHGCRRHTYRKIRHSQGHKHQQNRSHYYNRRTKKRSPVQDSWQERDGSNRQLIFRPFFFSWFFYFCTMKNITVIGAGTMGNGIAHVFAQNGFSVSLCDVSKEVLDKGLGTISKNLERQVSEGAITAEIKESTLKNITPCRSMSDAVKNTELVIEAATENIKLKKEIFIELDLLAPPSAILASNTSSISIT